VFFFGVLTSIVISVVAHELAHFVTARFLGLRPWWIRIGHGPVLFETQVRKVRLTLKGIPYSGVVYHSGEKGDQERWRWRTVLMVAAGPLCNALLFGIFWTATPKSGWSDSSNWQLICREMYVANAYLLLVSLAPFRAKTDGLKLPSDGLHLLLLLFGRWPWDRDGELWQGSWHLTVKKVRPEPILNLYREQLSNPALSQHERALVLDGFATCVLMYGAREFLAEADRYSQELCELKPGEWTVKGTRGSILVETGDLVHGMAMLLEVMEHDPSAFDRAIAASFLALAEFKKCNQESALKWLRISQDLDPNCASALRIGNIIAQQGPENGVR
jgi:hypothetical protein